MDRATAYRKGWEASKRTTTYDMDKAYDRFLARAGNHVWTDEYERDFTDGWIDYASDNGYLAPLG